ncbi:MAG TPA: hypothetical protein VGR69_04460 [Candidatus Rubrimentiphilum sp.]|nr:hypothetical protein [Candidatus Rubrimentiphilum sp.]
MQAPVRSDTFTVILYDRLNGTGNILSQGSTTATIVAGTANSVNVSFSGVIKAVAISSSSPNVTKGTSSTVPLSVLALDPDGNVIVGTYTTAITLSNSDTTASTTLSATSISSSSTTVTVTYNGSNNYTGSTITASAGGTNTADVIIGLGPSCSRINQSSGAQIRGYYPCDLQNAYNLAVSGGAGQTVAIVDAFDDPNAEADFDVYRATFGLPACQASTGCFRKVNQTGGTTYPAPDSGWASEISLDLDMASAACPNCKILLVEANSNDDTTVTGGGAFDLETAVNEAATLGASAISNSYGGNEDPSQTQSDSYYNHPGIAITASSGDDAYDGGTQYPASASTVIGVGGTHLVTAGNARGWSESVWFGRCSGGVVCGSGSGCSIIEAKPSWQTDTGCTKRMVADVAADADPATGPAVYDTYQATGWLVIGGTSASAPFVAGVFALAGNASSAPNPASYLYSHPSGLYDVTIGSNGNCGTQPAYFCTAESGYDGPTGLGTPNGSGTFSAFNTQSSVLESAAPQPSGAEVPTERACSPGSGRYACFALIRTDIGHVTLTHGPSGRPQL